MAKCIFMKHDGLLILLTQMYIHIDNTSEIGIYEVEKKFQEG